MSVGLVSGAGQPTALNPKTRNKVHFLIDAWGRKRMRVLPAMLKSLFRISLVSLPTFRHLLVN